ncbi:MAG: hypothetical protein IT361_09740 [Gemmatimonadaceae bacterium]|nr:hypothetical protein [Gemmatimonadaceae bacterium]
MTNWIGRLTPRHLLGSWLGYWTALGALALWKPATILMQLSRGSVSAGVDDGTLTLTIMQGGATTWMSAIPLSAVFGWITIPPLLLWSGWMLLRPRRNALASPAAAPALDAGTPPIGDFSAHRQQSAVPITPLP